MYFDRLIMLIHDGGSAELEGLVQGNLLAFIGMDVGVDEARDDGVAGLGDDGKTCVGGGKLADTAEMMSFLVAMWPDSIVSVPVKMRTSERMKLVAAIVGTVVDAVNIKEFQAFLGD